MSRHRSPQGRRAHHGPPLSAALAAAAGSGGAHRSIALPQVISTPARAVAALLAGGALAAAGQHALTTALPAVTDGTAALRVSLDHAVGLTPTGSTAPTAAVAPVAPGPAVADASSLIKAAELQKSAAEERAHTTTASGAAIVAAALGGSAAASDSGTADSGAAGPFTGIRILSGPVTSGFGGRWGAFHEGLDIAAPIGTPIHVPAAGTVISSGPASGFGLWVRVQHADGTITVYGHINRSFVSVGQHVAAGDVIAETGNRGQSTGPHLHIGVMVNGVYINPRPWLDARGVKY
ncbi:MAG TPA: M23 family metallopeptidase [Pseudonocardia sp.]